jgi:YD repeat-containing protein
VTEYTGNFSENTGKRVYEYMKSTRDIALSYPDHLTGPDLYRFWSPYYNYDQGLLTPILTSEEIFEFSDSKYTLRKGIYHYYNLRDKEKITCGVRIGFRDIWINVNNFSSGVSYFPYNSNEDFIDRNMAFYDIEAYRCFYLLDKTQTIEYNINGDITGRIDYIYDPEYRSLFPTEKQISKSDGTNYKEVLTYPFNINITPYTEMVQNNIINPVINKTKQFNTAESVSIQNNYRKDGSIFVIDNIQTGNNGTLEPRIAYHNYDSHGNPVYLSKDNLEKVIYLWSYNYQYPIAEIKNATYSDVCKKIGNGNEATGKTNLESIAAKAEPSSSDWTAVNNLRTQLPDAQITTYTYKPLVGLITQTDPRGVKTTYNYDSFGRLQGIKDENDKTTESYEYHYKN